MVAAAGTKRVGRCRPMAELRKKRRAKSTRGKRIISSSHRSLADLSRCYARGKEGVNQRTTRSEKEKICVAIISANRNAMRSSDALQQAENDSNCFSHLTA